MKRIIKHYKKLKETYILNLWLLVFAIGYFNNIDLLQFIGLSNYILYFSTRVLFLLKNEVYVAGEDLKANDIIKRSAPTINKDKLK